MRIQCEWIYSVNIHVLFYMKKMDSQKSGNHYTEVGSLALWKSIENEIERKNILLRAILSGYICMNKKIFPFSMRFTHYAESIEHIWNAYNAPNIRRIECGNSMDLSILEWSRDDWMRVRWNEYTSSLIDICERFSSSKPFCESECIHRHTQNTTNEPNDG